MCVYFKFAEVNNLPIVSSVKPQDLVVQPSTATIMKFIKAILDHSGLFSTNQTSGLIGATQQSAELLVKLMKDLGYPYKLTKTTVQTMGIGTNGTHVGIIEWLISQFETESKILRSSEPAILAGKCKAMGLESEEQINSFLKDNVLSRSPDLVCMQERLEGLNKRRLDLENFKKNRALLEQDLQEKQSKVNRLENEMEAMKLKQDGLLYTMQEQQMAFNVNRETLADLQTQLSDLLQQIEYQKTPGYTMKMSQLQLIMQNIEEYQAKNKSNAGKIAEFNTNATVQLKAQFDLLEKLNVFLVNYDLKELPLPQVQCLTIEDLKASGKEIVAHCSNTCDEIMRIFNENLDSGTSKLETVRKRYKYVSTVSQAMGEELQQLTEKANAVDSEEKRLESDLVKKLEELEKKKLDLTNAFLALKQEHASKLTTFRGFPDIANPTLEPELQVVSSCSLFFLKFF
ncbi:hypothetical protein Ciccas_013373 [Cichlidogyrus casuarinus]|uniref:Uncharacterized protein n=1 Tax=Cichlidogyrus casuarinus TaxID=1844966 RepID=A0ABD2PKV4_9PLAT